MRSFLDKIIYVTNETFSSVINILFFPCVSSLIWWNYELDLFVHQISKTNICGIHYSALSFKMIHNSSSYSRRYVILYRYSTAFMRLALFLIHAAAAIGVSTQLDQH